LTTRERGYPIEQIENDYKNKKIKKGRCTSSERRHKRCVSLSVTSFSRSKSGKKLVVRLKEASLINN